MKRLFSSRPLNTDLGIFLLRLTLGGLFIWHGYDKIAHYDLYLSMSKSIIGLGAQLEFNLVIFAEFACGIFVTLGLLTRLTVIPIFITMTIAYFIVHKADPFMKKELAFTFWLLCIPVFIFGSGRYAVDRLIFKK